MAMKRLVFLAGLAGGAVAAIKRRGGNVPQPVVEAAGRVRDAAPEPLKQAAERAVETVQSVTGGGTEDGDRERYEPPTEAGAQPPAEPGGPPSDDSPMKTASSVASDPADELATPEREPPGDAVMPDTSDDDPLVRQQEKAAAADAGSIGGNVDELAQNEPGFPEDPEMRPVIEGSGDDEETFEARDRELGGNRQTEP